ncbi:hypothetical protein PTKIN_Ptkin01aG0347200 [Pterospermum kingtungense]
MCPYSSLETVLSYLDPYERKKSPIHEIAISLSELGFDDDDQSPVQDKVEEDSTGPESDYSDDNQLPAQDFKEDPNSTDLESGCSNNNQAPVQGKEEVQGTPSESH